MPPRSFCAHSPRHGRAAFAGLVDVFEIDEPVLGSLLPAGLQGDEEILDGVLVPARSRQDECRAVILIFSEDFLIGCRVRPFSLAAFFCLPEFPDQGEQDLALSLGGGKQNRRLPLVVRTFALAATVEECL